MRKLSHLLFALFLLTACAREVHQVRRPKPVPEKLLVLPPASLDPSLRPYVIKGERYFPLPDSDGFVEYGKASWYGKEFHGRRTSSGEVYDMYQKTAAHKTLPMGTYVKVINFTNNKQTVVRINDRGPFVKGRIIDLSYAAARDIGLVDPGVAEAKVVALGKEVGTLQSALGPKPVVKVAAGREGEFTVQVGAFKDKKNALKLADRLRVLFDYVEVALFDDVANGRMYRVRVSKSESLAQAGEVERKLRRMGFEDLFILSL